MLANKHMYGSNDIKYTREKIYSIPATIYFVEVHFTVVDWMQNQELCSIYYSSVI